MANHVLIDPYVFDPAAISEETHAFNQKLMNIMAKGPKWWEVGAEEYRKMRARGETPLPAATHLDSAESFSIPSRDKGREIPCRVLKPTNGKPVQGIFMHVHGGGWVLQDEASQDPVLQHIADSTGLVAVSIGYRLAPEHAFPAAPHDCFDAAEWLVLNGESSFGAPFFFLGGESAGGHLSMLTLLHLIQHSDAKFSQDFRLLGLLCHFGVYDLSFTPSVYNFKKPNILVLDQEIMEHYLDVFLPGVSADELKKPNISPLYADLQSLRGRLPPALFTCGTEDPLLDDTIFMSAKWQAAGAETVVNIYPGAAHGYIGFSRDNEASFSAKGLDAVEEFVKAGLEHRNVGAP